MGVKNNPAAFLASAQSAEGVGSLVMDCRANANYGMLWYQASGHSAIFELQVSYDTTAWLASATFTATATQTAVAQVAGYAPYVRVNVAKVYSAAGGSGNLWVHYAPGID